MPRTKLVLAMLAVFFAAPARNAERTAVVRKSVVDIFEG